MDSSREDPTPKSHVMFSFSFSNETYNRDIKKIFFQVKFIDHSGNTITTTETLDLEVDLGPGEIGGSYMSWYYENTTYGSYNKLAPYVKKGNLKAKVDFEKILLADDTVLNYPQRDWVKHKDQRGEAEEERVDQEEMTISDEVEFAKSNIHIQGCELEPIYWDGEIDGWYVESEATNRSSKHLNGIEVKAVFKKDGELVTYLTDHLEPMGLKAGETGHFHISTTKDEKVDSVSCSIVDGWIDED